MCEAFLTLYLTPSLGVSDVDIWTSPPTPPLLPWLLTRLLPDLIALVHWRVQNSVICYHLISENVGTRRRHFPDRWSFCVLTCFVMVGIWGEVHTRLWWGNLREIDHLYNLHVGGRIILKWILRNKVGEGVDWLGQANDKNGCGFLWSRLWTLGGP